jgi:hypothetical protein
MQTPSRRGVALARPVRSSLFCVRYRTDMFVQGFEAIISNTRASQRVASGHRVPLGRADPTDAEGLGSGTMTTGLLVQQFRPSMVHRRLIDIVGTKSK